MNKRLTALVIVVAALAIVALVILVRPRSLAVGFQAGSVNYPMMYAVQDGFFRNAGLNVEAKVFQSANDGLDALLGGSIFMDAVIPIQDIARLHTEKPGSIGILALLLNRDDGIHENGAPE